MGQFSGAESPATAADFLPSKQTVSKAPLKGFKSAVLCLSPQTARRQNINNNSEFYIKVIKPPWRNEKEGLVGRRISSSNRGRRAAAPAESPTRQGSRDNRPGIIILFYIQVNSLRHSFAPKIHDIYKRVWPCMVMFFAFCCPIILSNNRSWMKLQSFSFVFNILYCLIHGILHCPLPTHPTQNFLVTLNFNN